MRNGSQYAKFNRSTGATLNGGPLVLNFQSAGERQEAACSPSLVKMLTVAALAGGLTLIACFQFFGTAGAWERLIDFGGESSVPRHSHRKQEHA